MKKEIIDELKNIAPGLLEIGNNNPFLVPAEYFDKLEIIEKSVKGRDSESLPTGYFENLSDNIISKAKPEKPVKIISLNVKRWMAAASVAILFVASYLAVKSNSVINENEFFALDIELEEVLDYLAEHDDIYLSDAIDLSQLELLEESEIVDGFYDSEIDLLLDEVTLDDLDELL